jgi:hypothetical protein
MAKERVTQTCGTGSSQESLPEGLIREETSKVFLIPTHTT